MKSMIKASRIFALCRSQQKHCSLNAGRSKLAHFFSFSLSISLAPSHSHVVFLSNFLLLQLLLLTAVIMHSPHFPAFPPPQQRATTRKNGRACEWERNIILKKERERSKPNTFHFFCKWHVLLILRFTFKNPLSSSRFICLEWTEA